MKTPKASSTKNTKENTPKFIQPEPLQVILPSSDNPQSSTPSSQPKSSKTMHVGTKRAFSTKGSSSSKPAKKAKVVDPDCAEEVAKEMSVGFGLDKYWYDSTPFPQLHAILSNQGWEELMSNFSCHPIYPHLMREFIQNFSIDNGVCSSMIKDIKIEFNSLMLGEWFAVPVVGFDTYYVGSKIVFSGITERTVLKFLGQENKKRFSHMSLSPLHKLLYNIARRFILPRNSKRSEVNLRDATLIYCMANHIKINFPSLMVSHLSECIEKGLMVGYGGLLTCVFKKFGVPLDGPEFPMSANNKISERCLTNLHLQLNEKGILEHAIEEVEVSSDEEEKEKVEKEEEEEEVKEKEKEDQEDVPSATTEAETDREQEEAVIEGEQVEREEEMGQEDDEDLHVPLKNIKKPSVLTPRKSRRLASKGSPSQHDDITSPTPPSPKPSSPKPMSPIPPPQSPKATTPPPFTSPPSPTGFEKESSPSPATPIDLILSKFTSLQSQLIAFQSEVRASLSTIAEQLTDMETRLGAKLDTVEVQTEFIDEETAA
jgi:transposase-like protein